MGTQTANPVPGPSPDLMESSLMTGAVLTTFAAFSTDSGASEEMAALMKIKESLAANRTKSAPAPGGPPAATPGFTISGDDAMMPSSAG